MLVGAQRVDCSRILADVFCYRNMIVAILVAEASGIENTGSRGSSSGNRNEAKQRDNAAKGNEEQSRLRIVMHSF